MKFAARDGSTARTLAASAPPRAAVTLGHTRLVSAGARPVPTFHPADGRTGDGQAADGNRPNNGAGRATRQRPTTVAYAPGQEIFAPGRGAGLVYIVRSGCVRLYKTLPDGRSVNLGLLGPNTVFAQEDGQDGLASGACAEALVDSTLSVVAADDLARLIAESPDLAAAVVAGMTRRLTELQTLVEHLLVRDTSVRLATTLLSLAKGFGRPTADGLTAIALPLTHQTLANMIGSNRVTVTRKLLELQERGMVRPLGRNSLAVAPDLLRAHAQAAAEAKE